MGGFRKIGPSLQDMTWRYVKTYNINYHHPTLPTVAIEGKIVMIIFAVGDETYPNHQ